ncbi:MAG TPA: WD40 repeat domain-containing protein [Gemmataceae bacterium]|nr:WD40 repeat domain-containing protein [Gemmataceae bacterium]
MLGNVVRYLHSARTSGVWFVVPPSGGLTSTRLKAELRTIPRLSLHRAVALVQEALRWMAGQRGKPLLMLLALGLAVGGAGLGTRSAIAEPSPPNNAEEGRAASVGREAKKPPGPLANDLYGDPLPEGASARLGTMRFRHGFLTHRAAFAPNGKVLASTGGLPFGVCLWDAATGRPLHRLGGRAYSLAFSPDGKTLFTGGRLALIDVATGKELRRLQPPALSAFDAVAFAPDGRTLAAGQFGGEGSKIFLWDAVTGKELRPLAGHAYSVLAVAFSPDGKALASGGDDNMVRLWDMATGKELHRFKGHTKTVWTVAFAPGGRILASGGEDHVVRLWDVKTGKPLRELKGHAGGIYSFHFSPDGKILATGGADTMVRLWAVEAGKLLRSWDTGAALGSVAFAPDGKVLASAGASGVRLWDTTTGQEIDPVPGHRGTVLSLRWSPDGKTLFSCGMDRQVLEWDALTGRPRGRPHPELLGTKGTRWLAALDLSPDGKIVAQVGMNAATATPEPIIYLWDVLNNNKRHALAGHLEFVRWLRFAPDGKLLASAGSDGIRLWDTTTGKALSHLAGHREDGSSFAFSHDGKWLVSAGRDQTVRLWQVATGQELRRWDSRQLEPPFLHFSPDGQSVVGIGLGGRVFVWDAATGTLRRQLGGAPEGDEGMFAATLSPSGHLVATGATRSRRLQNGDSVEDCTIHLWEVASGEAIRRVAAPQGSIWSLAFAPDGRVLASGGGDSTILLWDLTEGLKPGPLTARQLDGLWSDLAGEAPKAYRAVWILAGAPRQSVPFLKERLRPAAPAAAPPIARLVGDLASKSFAAREKAAAALVEMGEAAEGALRKILDSGPTLEVQRRLEQILEKRNKDAVRMLRAIEALGHIGNAEAHRVLDALAKEAVHPWVAREAGAARERLAGRLSAKPR